jgi:hypothetical protein
MCNYTNATNDQGFAVHELSLLVSPPPIQPLLEAHEGVADAGHIAELV